MTGNADRTGLHVGLIAGLGPAATVAYYQKLSEIAAARGHRLELTMVQAEIREVAANNHANRSAEQATIFASLLGRLKAAGADFASIPAIGPHFCYEELKPLSPLPLLSAIAPLDAYCARQGYRRIGLLGTARAMQTRLFGQMSTTEMLVPSNLDAVGKTYQDMATDGRCSDEARQMFFAAGAEMMQNGAEAIALAGTDLLLAFDGRDPGFPVIDVLEIHVEVLADLATGRKTLAEAGVQ
ncbi:aspartate/glutamate racemase family protein [Paracoccus ravus]|uniref:aspartate/glutamate racemase family protein n=1 Tax=Paracoccus ravus TaxID=2447760 RepID=UPI00106E90A7|nr:aspartate/glutamate racemase family protein [Paracoccus ravus]